MIRFLLFVLLSGLAPSLALVPCPALPRACAQEMAVAAESGIDQSILSQSIEAGDDFYRYANEGWLKSTKIPSDKSNYGMFTVLDDRTRQQVRELIEKAAQQRGPDGSAEQKVGDLYRSVMDVEARNAAGVKPLQEMLGWIDAATAEDLPSVAGKLSRRGVNAGFGVYVDVDAKNSSQYVAYATQTGLTLPDRDYYLEDEPRYVQLRDDLADYIVDMMTFIAVDNPQQAAEQIVKLETQLAQFQWSQTENRDPIKTYNKKTKDQLQQWMAGFDWDSYAQASGLDQCDIVVVQQPSYLKSLAETFAAMDLATIKNYLRFRVIDGFASSLSETIERRHFAFHSTSVSDVEEQEPLWKRAVNTAGSVLGELVGESYVGQHFKPNAKQRMNQLVLNLKSAFESRIKTRDWMGDGTKKQAQQKLSKFTTKIGYPDEWKDYSALKIDSPLLADNLIAYSEFEHNRDLGKLGGPIDRNEWHMTPQTINAYYNPVMNEIVFPAAILQPPFFNLMADDAVNYGAIGAVIGHELSHGFDDKGSKYDGDGNLRSWWTPEDREEFDRRAGNLTAQYDQYEPFEGNPVNGKLTLGENIGDLGGLSVAYEAYRLSLDGKEAPVIDGLTGDQRFFLGWAQIWRRLYRKPELLKRLKTDPHSPSQYRVNGIVRNMDAWYQAFDVTQDDDLYLPPESRVRIW